MGLFDKLSDIANGAKDAIKEGIEEEKRHKQEREDAVKTLLKATNEPWFSNFHFSKYARTPDEKRLEFAAYGVKQTHEIKEYGLKHNYQFKNYPFTDQKKRIDDVKKGLFTYEIDYYDLEKVFRNALKGLRHGNIGDICLVNVFQQYHIDASVYDDELFVLLAEKDLADSSKGYWEKKFSSNYIEQEHEKKKNAYVKKKKADQFRSVVKDSEMTQKIISCVRNHGDDVFYFIVGINGFSVYGMNSFVIEGYSYQQLGYPDLNDDQLDILKDHLLRAFGKTFELLYDEYDNPVFRRRNAIRKSW